MSTVSQVKIQTNSLFKQRNHVYFFCIDSSDIGFNDVGTTHISDDDDVLTIILKIQNHLFSVIKETDNILYKFIIEKIGVNDIYLNYKTAFPLSVKKVMRYKKGLDIYIK